MVASCFLGKLSTTIILKTKSLCAMNVQYTAGCFCPSLCIFFVLQFNFLFLPISYDRSRVTGLPLMFTIVVGSDLFKHLQCNGGVRYIGYVQCLDGVS